MRSLPQQGAALPGPTSSEQSEASLQRFSMLASQVEAIHRDLHYRAGWLSADDKKTVADAERLLKIGFHTVIEVGRAAIRKATAIEINQHLAVLVGCMAGQKLDMRLYSAALVEDVGALQPSIGALEAACRHLRRTCTFVPTIAECLQAIRDRQKAFDGFSAKAATFAKNVETLPLRIAEAKASASEAGAA